MGSLKQLGVFLFFCVTLGYSQSPGDKVELPKIIPPSPTVASLMQFEEVPIDHYTGQPDINIPITNKQLNADLALPIALKYSSLGIKLSERSGWTGTGWSLEAGGTISRTIKGVPDDAYPSGGTIAYGVYNLPASEFDMWGGGLLTDYQKNEYLWAVRGNNQQKYDSELDLYQFSILGATGRFVVDIDGLTLKPKLLSKDQNIKIVVQSTITQVNGNYVIKINGFTLTDANGYKYLFGSAGSTGTPNAIEITSAKPYSISYPQFPDGGVAPDFVTYNNEVVSSSAWHLTSIQTANSQILASFYYTISPIVEQYNTYANTTEFILPAPQNYYSYVDQQTNQNAGFNRGSFKPKRSISYNRIIVNTRKLSYISFPDNTRIDFITGDTHPEYVVYQNNLPPSSSTGTRLLNVKLKDAVGSVYKQFTFNYEVTTPAVGPNQPAPKRLWLTKVLEQATGDTNLSYDLDYFEKQNLPGFGQGDGWGYMPAMQPTGGGIFFDTNYKKGLLTSITFPTGGVKEFNWEPHTFSYEGNALLPKSVTNDNPENQTNSGVSKAFTCNWGCNTSVFSSSFTIADPQSVYISVSGTYPEDNGEYWIRFEKSSGGTWTSVGVVNAESGTKFLDAGTYRFSVAIGYAVTTDSYFNATVSVRYANMSKGNRYKQYLKGGGVRINSVIFKEATGATAAREINYYYNEPQTETTLGNPVSGQLMPEIIPAVDFSGPSVKSSGSVDAKSGSLFKEDTVGEPALLQGANGQCSTPSILYNYKSNEQTAQITKGGYVGYKYVRVREKDNGYTAYTHTSPQDYYHDPFDAVYSYPFPEGENLDFKRGLLTKKEVYDEQVKLLEETINIYHPFTEEVLATSYSLFEVPCAYTKYYDSYTKYVNGNINFVGTIPCASTATRCDMNNPPVAPFNFLPVDHTAGWAKLKESIVKKYFYGSTTENSEVKTSYEYNLSNYQIKTEVASIKENGIVNLYKTEYQYPTPATDYEQSLFNSTELSVINSMRSSYNMLNKPIVITTYKNDEQLQRIVNKYSNTLGATLPLLSELETLKGPSGSAEDRLVYTKYDVKGNPLSVKMANGKVVSYLWGYNKTLPIAMVEGMDYAAIASNLGLVDEAAVVALNEASMTQINSLRSLPGRLVTTLTHDPAKGVTSVTDPLGNVMYYKYDDMGRLTHVVDSDNNIISQNKYNYRTQN